MKASSDAISDSAIPGSETLSGTQAAEARQQAVVAHLGQQALGGQAVDELMQEAVSLAADQG